MRSYTCLVGQRRLGSRLYFWGCTPKWQNEGSFCRSHLFRCIEFCDFFPAAFSLFFFCSTCSHHCIHSW